jgi:hypothetical protein
VLSPDIRTTVSLCTKCGMYQTTTEHCLPFTSIALRRSHSQTQTPMSLVVQKHRLQLFHRHQWVMATIRGNRQWETGPAAFLSHRVSPPFSTFIDTLATYSSLATTEKWLDRALDPNRTFSYGMAMDGEPVPTSQTEFKIWWERVETGKFSQFESFIEFPMEHLPKTSSSGRDEE